MTDPATPAEILADAKAAQARLDETWASTIAAYIATGGLLLAARYQCGHGPWRRWIEEAGIDPDAAQAMMDIAAISGLATGAEPAGHWQGRGETPPAAALAEAVAAALRPDSARDLAAAAMARLAAAPAEGNA